MTPTTMMTTATAPTENEMKDRVVKAAIMWVYDQSCASALVALEDAVEEYVGPPVSVESKS